MLKVKAQTLHTIQQKLTGKNSRTSSAIQADVSTLKNLK